MTFIYAKERNREIADNCGAALDIWRKPRKKSRWWMLDVAIVLTFAAMVVSFLVATSPAPGALYAPDPIERNE